MISSGTSDRPSLKLPVSERDHIQGSPEAKVTLLEYGDYQCPYCGEAYPIVKQIQKRFGNDLRFVFRNFPLTQAHPRAEFGAETAEASGAQGKFWEMHDFIYEHQPYLGDAQLLFGAAESKIDLDSQKLRKDVESHTFLPRIKEDFMSGVRSGVNGTPTFFINGLRHNGDFEYDTLVAAIQEEAEEASTPQKQTGKVIRKRKTSSKSTKTNKKKGKTAVTSRTSTR